ncbi:MAG TPA: SDR family oxidoreductase [Rhodothermales bacterium]|nr:short-chain dehydrogenase [Bacteroidota bacterium]HRK73403.1 SDR family oxidoreductase [Rhodothermales bacterium]HRR08765.1 SDR family oxidoreductase [Rhodothermales bacterium]
MKGKTILVTGASAGIGAESVKQLAAMGAQLVLVGRNEAKCQKVASDVKRTTGNDAVHVLVADLSSMAAVRQLATTYKSRFDRLDVLLNNAGAMFLKYEESPDGIEQTLALNHLNYFLLTHELLDILTQTQGARVVNVASDAHRPGKIDLSDLQMRQTYSGWGQYCNSKLMNIMFTYAAARRLGGKGITINCLHPGFVASDFGDNNASGAIGKLFVGAWRFAKKLSAISVEKGAATQVYLASSPEVAGISGHYFSNRKAVKSSALSYDNVLGEALWSQTEALVGVEWA